MKIASLVDSMALNQNTFYMTKYFNNLYKKGLDAYAFYVNLSNHGVSPRFGVMNVYYATLFSDGVMFATDLKTLDIILKLNINCEKIFYCWDLEWLYGAYDYNTNISLLRNNNIKLAARSHSHSEAIENYCNRKVDYVINDWNLDDFIGVKQ